MQFYANALRDAIRKVNSRRKDALESLTTADWRALVYRELQADNWYAEPMIEAFPAEQTSEVIEETLPLAASANVAYLITMQSDSANERLDAEARQVLHLLAHGEHAGQISERLGIDKRRVYWVREKLRRRFGAKTNEHLIQRAAAEGFIYPGD